MEAAVEGVGGMNGCCVVWLSASDSDESKVIVGVVCPEVGGVV